MTEFNGIVGIVMAASVFGLVLSIWAGAMLIWLARRSARKTQLEQRLGIGGPSSETGRVIHLWRDGKEAVTTVPGLDRRRRSDVNARAGWPVARSVVLLTVASLMALVAVATFVLLGNVIFAVGMAGALLVGFRILEKHRITAYDARFERQFIDALELAARSLRAGHPLLGAFHLVSEEMSAPVSEVFGEICQQHAMGAELDEVLRDAARRTTSPDMKILATSVAIQARSGGNMANLMDRLAVVIRERIRLSRRVRILTAQTQMSKRILLVLPVVVFLLFSVLNPTYMTPLYTTVAGQLMLGFGVVFLAFGAWAMNRMAVLRY